MEDTFYIKSKRNKDSDVLGFEIIFTSKHMQIIQTNENTHGYLEDTDTLHTLFKFRLMHVGIVQSGRISSIFNMFVDIYTIVGDGLIGYSELGDIVCESKKFRNWFSRGYIDELKVNNGGYIIKPYDTGFSLESFKAKNKDDDNNIFWYYDVYKYIKYRLGWDELGISGDVKSNFVNVNLRQLFKRCYSYYGEGVFIEFDKLRSDILEDKEVLDKDIITIDDVSKLKILSNTVNLEPELGVILRVENPDINNEFITFSLHLKINESKENLKKWYLDNKLKVYELLKDNKKLQVRHIDLSFYQIKSIIIGNGNIMRITFSLKDKLMEMEDEYRKKQVAIKELREVKEAEKHCKYGRKY